LSQAWAAQQPRFHLESTLERDAGIPAHADWRKERLFDGAGWILGTVTRGDGSVMKGGYTVIHPTHGEPFVLTHCYVLGAFDLSPSGHLLVTVRDPEHYWPQENYSEEVQDPIELVWYDKKWEEMYSTVLEYAATDFPDGFVLSPKQRYLLAIRHPVLLSGDLAHPGHSLDMIDLRDGAIQKVYLPEYDGFGFPPPDWWPVRMQWDSEGRLDVQGGKKVRVYTAEWME